MNGQQHLRLAWVACLILSLLLGSCSRAQRTTDGPAQAAMVGSATDEELRELLNRYVNEFEAALSTSSDRILSADPGREVRKNILLWRSRMATRIRIAASQSDSYGALHEVWMEVIRHQLLMETDHAELAFKAGAEEVGRAAEIMTARIESIAAGVLPAQAFQESSASIREFSRINALDSNYTPQTAQGFSVTRAGGHLMETIIGIPMTPIRAARSVQEATDSIGDFMITASRFADIVEDLPRESRIQAELLAYAIEETESIQEVRETLRRANLAADEITQLAANLPEVTRAVTGAALAEVLARQEELADLLHEVALTTATVREAIEEANTVVLNSDRTSHSLEATAREIRLLLADVSLLLAPAPPDPNREPGRRFDITDYERSAEALGETARELRGLIGDVQNTIEGPEAIGLIRQAEIITQRTLSSADATARDVIDHAFRRAVQLVVVLLVAGILLLLVVRMLAVRRTRAAAG